GCGDVALREKKIVRVLRVDVRDSPAVAQNIDRLFQAGGGNGFRVQHECAGDEEATSYRTWSWKSHSSLTWTWSRWCSRTRSCFRFWSRSWTRTSRCCGRNR